MNFSTKDFFSKCDQVGSKLHCLSIENIERRLQKREM